MARTYGSQAPVQAPVQEEVVVGESPASEERAPLLQEAADEDDGGRTRSSRPRPTQGTPPPDEEARSNTSYRSLGNARKRTSHSVNDDIAVESDEGEGEGDVSVQAGATAS